jgi:hypothetical protein
LVKLNGLLLRRGLQLLESGAVAVVGVRPKPAAVLVEMRCTPGTVRAAAQALAQRADTTFVYPTTGTGDCVAEILTEPAHMGDVLSDELPSTIGLRDSTSYPVLRYFRTIRGRRPAILSADRAEAFLSGRSADEGSLEAPQELGRQDKELIDALCTDGRMSFEALGRRANPPDSCPCHPAPIGPLI